MFGIRMVVPRMDAPNANCILELHLSSFFLFFHSAAVAKGYLLIDFPQAINFLWDFCDCNVSQEEVSGSKELNIMRLFDQFDLRLSMFCTISMTHNKINCAKFEKGI